MRNAQPPATKEYTIHVKFYTARTGRGDSITGGAGFGEVDVAVEGFIDPDNGKKSPNLIKFCHERIQANPKVNGSVIGLEILEIVEKGSAAAKQPPPARLKPSGPAKPSSYGRRCKMLVIDRARDVNINGDKTMVSQMKCELCSYVTYFESPPNYCQKCGARIVGHVDVSL